MSAATPASAREKYGESRAQAIAGFELDLDPDRLLRKLSNATDQLLKDLWRTHGFERKAALIAVGGYGRAELFPYSDVDLLIIIEESTREALSPTLEGFVGACWDLGLEIGHSVRSIDECLSESARDLTVQTSLLEMRSLAGSRRLFTSLKKKLAEQLDPKEFFQGKMLELHQRPRKIRRHALQPRTQHQGKSRGLA